jgi:hypothetical protein
MNGITYSIPSTKAKNIYLVRWWKELFIDRIDKISYGKSYHMHSVVI